MQNSKLKSQNLTAKKQEVRYKNDLKQRVFQFALRIMRLVDALPQSLSLEGIKRQVLRSSSSIGANVFEAQAASSRKDFINFITYSLKSANETLFWLSLLKDRRGASLKDIESAISENNEIARILGTSVITLKKRNEDF